MQRDFSLQNKSSWCKKQDMITMNTINICQITARKEQFEITTKCLLELETQN